MHEYTHKYYVRLNDRQLHAFIRHVLIPAKGHFLIALSFFLMH
jgi:hypothetical protein